MGRFCSRLGGLSAKLSEVQSLYRDERKFFFNCWKSFSEFIVKLYTSLLHQIYWNLDFFLVMEPHAYVLRRYFCFLHCTFLLSAADNSVLSLLGYWFIHTLTTVIKACLGLSAPLLFPTKIRIIVWPFSYWRKHSELCWTIQMRKRKGNQKQLRGMNLRGTKKNSFQNKLSQDRFLYGKISVRLIKSNLFLKSLGIVESPKIFS